ncbi:hypothetical protein [Streptomyces sp. C10-9-1]|uniref:hypothetical protein n=1 Tax=Streptomyces sp. C10-9-1 TaxID=1859285 RepID=UPI003D73E47F
MTDRTETQADTAAPAAGAGASAGRPATEVLPGPVAQAEDGTAGPRTASRLRRATALWAAALLVCGGAGAGTALAITSAERSDVPGLRTQADGRWDYPRLSLPALPSGVPRPFTKGNDGEVHHADLRDLLLPAPRGAKADEVSDGGFVPVDRYLAEYEEEQREELRQALTDLGLRHVAARAWTMPDGVRARVYLLRFPSVAYATAYKDRHLVLGRTVETPLAAGPESVLDGTYTGTGKVAGTSSYVYSEPRPYGREQLRQGYVLAGDTLALVVHARKGGVPAVPFHQSLVLQNQLLG